MSSRLKRLFNVINYIVVGTLIIIPAFALSIGFSAIIIPITLISSPIEYVLFGKLKITSELFEFAMNMKILKLSAKMVAKLFK